MNKERTSTSVRFTNEEWATFELFESLIDMHAKGIVNPQLREFVSLRARDSLLHLFLQKKHEGSFIDMTTLNVRNLLSNAIRVEMYRKTTSIENTPHYSSNFLAKELIELADENSPEAVLRKIEVLRNMGFDSTKIAESCECSRSTLSRVMHGKYTPSKKFVLGLQKMFNEHAREWFGVAHD